MDAPDRQWLASFIGAHAIPEDAVPEGFVAVLAWLNPDGSRDWRPYVAMDAPMSYVVGLLAMAQFELMHQSGHGDD